MQIPNYKMFALKNFPKVTYNKQRFKIAPRFYKDKMREGPSFPSKLTV